MSYLVSIFAVVLGLRLHFNEDGVLEFATGTKSVVIFRNDDLLIVESVFGHDSVTEFLGHGLVIKTTEDWTCFNQEPGPFVDKYVRTSYEDKLVIGMSHNYHQAMTTAVRLNCELAFSKDLELEAYVLKHVYDVDRTVYLVVIRRSQNEFELLG